MPPEVSRSGWDSIKSNPLSSTDSYQFGLLIFEVYNGGLLSNDQIGQTKNVPPSIHQSYKRLLNPNPKARLSITHFLEQGRRNGGFFETPLIRLSEGVESLGLKSDAERAELLRSMICLNCCIATANFMLVNLMKYRKTSPKISSE